MKLIYTAGPIRSKKGNWYVKKNLDIAEEVARKLWTWGHGVICPQLNSAWMDGDDLDHHNFMAGDLEMVSRCDAIVLLPGWRMSEGASEEYRHAKRCGIDIFMWPSDESTLQKYGEEGLQEVERRRENEQNPRLAVLHPMSGRELCSDPSSD